MQPFQTQRLYILIGIFILLAVLLFSIRASKKQSKMTKVAPTGQRKPTLAPTPNTNLLKSETSAYIFYCPNYYEKRDDPNADITYTNVSTNNLGGNNGLSLQPSQTSFKRDLIYSISQCRQIAYAGVPPDLKPKLKETIFIEKPHLKGCINIYTTGYDFYYVDYIAYKIPITASVQNYRITSGYPASEKDTQEATDIMDAIKQFTIK